MRQPYLDTRGRLVLPMGACGENLPTLLGLTGLVLGGVPLLLWAGKPQAAEGDILVLFWGGLFLLLGVVAAFGGTTTVLDREGWSLETWTGTFGTGWRRELSLEGVQGVTLRSFEERGRHRTTVTVRQVHLRGPGLDSWSSPRIVGLEAAQEVAQQLASYLGVPLWRRNEKQGRPPEEWEVLAASAREAAQSPAFPQGGFSTSKHQNLDGGFRVVGSEGNCLGCVGAVMVMGSGLMFAPLGWAVADPRQGGDDFLNGFTLLSLFLLTLGIVWGILATRFRSIRVDRDASCVRTRSSFLGVGSTRSDDVTGTDRVLLLGELQDSGWGHRYWVYTLCLARGDEGLWQSPPIAFRERARESGLGLATYLRVGFEEQFEDWPGRAS